MPEIRWRQWVVLLIQFLAREFGDETVYAKLKIHSETNDEPSWDTETGEFTWRFGP